MILPLADIWFQIPQDRPNWNMAYSLAIAGLGFALTTFAGRYIIALLRRYKIGKQVRIDGPQSHIQTKTGTPTMGGIIFNLTAFALTFVFNLYDRLSMLLPLGVLLCCGLLGAIDDRLSLVGGSRAEGMTARFKFAWLFLFATVAAVILYGPLDLHHANIPILGRFDIGLAYIPIAILGIMGTAHAVNLTDGLDTLAGGTGAIAFVSYGIIGYIQGQVGVVTFCFIMVGALLGFLWHNAHPAQVFMGDTGSLALGASLATAAFMTGQWFLLPVVGLIFVVEALSVILQVAYFKLTGGRRLFKMSPIHHHFELIGWSETQVTMRFWLVGMMAGLFGVALALL
ncbi:MAG: Phospho-N-acetylmuramoyl-pentapeptide-transferase [uncultured Thermomicrobiales bacterium]|uniref:Phospho-N-acetylmuramoyl-pentapeptide-transferase n=1 Tax=uncultured Thermomicrobiales bacterium TaxID=1645740 RepID=A0A6J4VUS9_9BACT|nr:MAG: Phospho-N-acetylmuramoyl-pentapeptide-transferase [uncultured Thermomicrobiales bacterium]